MNKDWTKKIIPHIVAILIFVVVSLFFCKPVLNGYTLNQIDVVGWKGSAQNAFDVKEKTGKYPLWNTNVFSGMPNYQIILMGKGVLPDTTKIFGLGLPNPANYFFIACLCFYILCVALRLNPVINMLGALAYGFSTYNPVILSAGHESKMMAIAFMPLMLAGLVMLFSKRYWIGLAVATLGAYQELMSSHPQINYYFFIIAGLVSLFYVVRLVKLQEFKHIGIVVSLSLVAFFAALGTYALSYMSTKEYAEYTMRGGKTLEIQGDQVKAVKTSGLDEDYAFQYSMKPVEPFVMLMPNAFGGSSSTPLKESTQEKIVTGLIQQGVPAESAQQFVQFPAYWGGMTKPGEVGTAGPPYVGAIIFLCAFIGFIFVNHPARWGLLIASVLSVLMSWGSYFPSFNGFLFNTLPFYNKFRAPSMALVITQLTLPLMAAITVHRLFFEKDSRDFLQLHLKKILYAFGGLTALLALIYLGQSYTSGYDQQLMNPQIPDSIKSLVLGAVKAERQSVFGGQVLRTLLFVIIILAFIYGYVKNMIKPGVAVILLTVIIVADLFIIDKKYLTDEQYVPKEDAEVQNFIKTPIDNQILQDQDPHYRVLDMMYGFNSNIPSYYHRSVMGYHAAKLRVYQDIIERYFSNGTPNQEILNALDTKYFIFPNQQNAPVLEQNSNAYGAAWFVKSVLPAKDEIDELQKIGNTRLKDTAIVPQADAAKIGAIQFDSTASITLVNYSNDMIEYSTNAASAQFAVLSEVYYPAGWKAMIDGQPVPIIKTDYFLRGLQIPAGKHAVKLVFDPETVKKGIEISYMSSIAVAVLVIGGFAMQWWVDHKKKNKLQA